MLPSVDASGPVRCRPASSGTVERILSLRSLTNGTSVWVFPQVSRQLSAYSGKPDLGGVSNRKRTTAHWEWRDGGSSVYPPGCRPAERSTVLSGGVGRGSVLIGLSKG